MTGDRAPGRRVFPGDGEMARRMRGHDWAGSGLGEPSGWPVTLQETCRICLTSRYPMVILWGPELRCLYNDAYMPLLGSKHPALGVPCERVWEEVWDRIGPQLRAVLETGEATWSQDLLLPLRRHGFPEETYWTFSNSPLFDGSRVGGVLTVVTETTQQVVGERRLAALHDLGARTGAAEGVVAACHQVAGVLERNARDVPFAAIYLGREPEPVCTSPPGTATGTAWPVAEVMRTGRSRVVDPVTERLPAGGWEAPPHEAMVLPLNGDEDGAIGAIVLAAGAGRPMDRRYRRFFDLVARQTAALVNGATAHEAQRRRAEELAELDRLKTVFFSDVSHEFRTPLTLIDGSLEDLRDNLRDAGPATREDLEVIRRSGLRMEKLVDSLLEFSRIEAGRMGARYEPVDLAVFTADLTGVFRAAMEKAGVRFRVDCLPLPEPVYVDRDMWEKIVLNLLSNALKFTFEGTIRVRLRAEDGQAVLRVSDTGVGVAPEDVPRMFERFHRLRPARARSHEGSSIGLALVRELVRLHGGTIDAHSVEGEGTTFTVRIPFGHGHLPADSLAPPERGTDVSAGADPFVEEALRWLPEDAGREWETPPGQTPTAALRFGGPARVLVADDNRDMRAYLRRLLRPGYEVQTVGDGLAALETARSRPPDLVIADVMMPGMDGLRLVAELRSDPRTARVPVLLLSALAGPGSSVEGLAAGADDYLVKPFSAAELKARVRANVEMARLRNQSAEWRNALFESLQEAFMVLDGDGTVLEANTACRTLLGYGPEGLPYPVPHPWWPDEADDPVAHRQFTEAFEEAVRERNGSKNVPMTHRDGHRLWVAVAYNETRTPDTGELRTLMTLRDITAERTAAQHDMALANLSLRLSTTETLPETMRAAMEEMAALWETRRILAVDWDERDQVHTSPLDPGTTWDGLPGGVRSAIETLRTHPPLRPETFADPAGIGVTLEFYGGPMVLWIEPNPHRPFVAEDHALLVALCGYLGQAVHRIGLAEQQREAVLEVQRTILAPADLPSGFAVRYEPAARPLQVGGDWYDVFDLPDGLVGIVVGDCVGRGVQAATVMGQLRSACRALLLQLGDPARALAALDNFAGMTPKALGTTVFCCVLNMNTGEMSYSSAGHLPAFKVHANRRVELLEGGRGLPLAVLPGEDRPADHCLLTPEAVLVLYTDGLVERRDRSLDIGIDKAAEVTREGRDLPVEELADRLMTRLSPPGGYDDDVALLLFRRPLGLDVPFPAEAMHLAHVRAELRAWMAEMELHPLVVHNVLTAAGEACANAAQHATGSRARLTASRTGDELQITVSDTGRWKKPHPDGAGLHGRGLYLIRALMQEVTIDHGPSGTTVDMRTRLTP
ncbi:SpoIIE family protein phosphatase [Thermomonospora cellulosilytica]|uniref:histidine kinase n=1 Tax=Thermomonospora cellulosilytica TaxID=1411118 RepID=A0A7W3MU00_9ACTN|nr:SpoIIE family protein phosphatase [Thermomonospora cellulosilytica]MBA9001833.1 PAS domain S-box-containing protein [Thermomonospora cellulosilytica]